MEWRLKRVGGALEPSWGRYDGLDRSWSWTTDETQAFSAHNRYIVEAMQRRAPDWLRHHTNVECKDDGIRPTKRPAKQEEAKC